MRIDCVSFLDPEVYGGGGEMISRRLLETGRARGHDLRITSVRQRRRDLHARPDLTLLIDVFNHGHTLLSLGAWRSFGEDFLESVIGRAPFVHLNNGYTDVCNLGYLPCSGNAAPECPKKPLPLSDRVLLRDFGKRCFAIRPIVRRLYEDAALNIFQSPLHERVIRQVLGAARLPPSFTLRPQIDAAVFHNEGRTRDIEYLFVGVIGEAKCLAQMRERFRDTDIHLIGRCAPGVKLDFGRHVGQVPYAEIPRWMNRAKHFVFLPRWPDPQGRVVAEAALCGCKIIANDNVGALSFGFDLADPAQYAGAEDAFWERLETLR